RLRVLEKAGAWEHPRPAVGAQAGAAPARRGEAAAEGVLAGARRRLAEARLSREQAEALVAVAAELGVEGNAAECSAALAARANAALAGRSQVFFEDLAIAVQLVLAPRAARPWEPPPGQGGGVGVEGDGVDGVDPRIRSSTHQAALTLPSPPAAAGEGDFDTPIVLPGDTWHDRGRADGAGRTGGTGQMDAAGATSTGRVDGGEGVREALLAAARGCLPPAALRPSAVERKDARRGRCVRAVPAGGRQGVVALAATVRAALPWQRPRGWSPGHPLVIRPQDLRLKRFTRPPRRLHVVVLDASGSMASNRMAQAKGAIRHLLRHAYVRRDRVALIAFRGREAALLLPPSRSFARFREALDALPAGGATPLAAGLELALRTILAARRQSPDEEPRLLLVTDGRGNAGQDEETWQRIRRLIAAQEIESLLIDTRPFFDRRGEAARLARDLHATHVHLEDAAGPASPGRPSRVP
ncbi:MAG: VWA domain-containing protein, partial [Chloroflexota bacterium]